MTFANPLGLIGLLSLPLILWLHLIRERHKRYIVSNLDLWSFLEDEARGPRPRRIPLSWLLVLDLAVASLFGLAWAQPRLHLPLPAFNARQMVLLVDISSSMLAGDGQSDRMSLAKADAAALIRRSGPRDVVTVLAFGRKPYWVGDSRQEDSERLEVLVSGLEAGESGYALRESLALGQASLEGSLPAEFYVLTDGAFPEPEAALLQGFPHPLEWRFVGETGDNQAVLELDAEPQGDGRYQVFARIANFGDRWAARSVSLLADGQVIDRSQVEIPADSTLPQVWQVSGDYSTLSVSLLGQDLLQEDDSASIGLRSSGRVRVVLVAESPSPLQQALQAVPQVDLEVTTPQDYSRTPVPPPADLTVFRGFLPSRWPDGPVLLVEPPSARDSAQGGPAFEQLAATTRREISASTPLQVAARDPVLSEVDFSGVRWSGAWGLPAVPGGFTPLLQAGDVPLLLKGEIPGVSSGAHPLWVLLADLSRGNFTKHPAFPILIANLVEAVYPAPVPPSIRSGETVQLPEPGVFRSLQILSPEGDPDDFTADWPRIWDETRAPGLYRFVFQDTQGEPAEYVLGVNAGDVNESDLRLRGWVETAAMEQTDPPAGLARTGEADRVQEPWQIELMPWLLGAAVLALLLEAILAWRR